MIIVVLVLELALAERVTEAVSLSAVRLKTRKPKDDKQNAMKTLPKARNTEIVVQKIDEEVLIYDLIDDKAHHMNKTISLIWEKCDGETTFEEINKLLTKELGMSIESDFIWLALDELNKANLLRDEIKKSEFTKLSRRKVIFRYALPAVSLPVVMSLVSPKSIHAQSCTGQLNDFCGPGTPGICCVPGLVCQLTPGGHQCIPAGWTTPPP